MPAVVCDPESCSDLWLAAIRAYFQDCQRAANGSQNADTLSALSDLDGSREQLARLCKPMGIDIEVAAHIIGLALGGDSAPKTH